ncbi:MAG: hypothetical protein G4V63_18820 [Candidatus Afipia apatlaquensis]|jgi:hypothetical protein|uniref:Uncharacterized protein n=1 Tax=Candidatus Afipia apatlaquensis TaxID=2712852 RepID=A0A7C9RH65_9BRAD|nr:hypothetical protein [Candidatus Afipia apatlaquensis]
MFDTDVEQTITMTRPGIRPSVGNHHNGAKAAMPQSSRCWSIEDGAA